MSILTVTPAAVEQITHLLNGRGKPSLGIRVGIKTRGCSGLSYYIEFADEKNPYDEVIQLDTVTVLIDPKAIMFVFGIVMDFETNDLESGFTFKNPNEKGRCGCGESFHV
ncbi:HesB/IscA family protein [Candidatus Bodocaedibacter vickermanii]|uniref:Iron-binding protein IscA n=1 Tax=Candidatus Bodocaedibacter vickermanii TaxID=2741701 RepID=A0A7L9RTM0_9PROT|nr:Iron-binding protein IscA [Candidatus Paracaedibacteraceae bacterium 'Lake Konstanz']